MLDGATPEREPVVWQKWQVIPDVVINADSDAEDHEAPVGHWMVGEEPGRGGGKDPNADQLPGMQILGDPDVGQVVLVVDGMHVTVEEPVLVQKNVQGPVLKVEDQQSSQEVPGELPQGGCLVWEERLRGPHPLCQRDGHQVDEVVPDGQHHGLADGRPLGRLVRIDLVFLDPVPVTPEDINDHPWDAAGEIIGHGHQDGEER